MDGVCAGQAGLGYQAGADGSTKSELDCAVTSLKPCVRAFSNDDSSITLVQQLFLISAHVTDLNVFVWVAWDAGWVGRSAWVDKGGVFPFQVP